jgi:hypothetical protein
LHDVGPTGGEGVVELDGAEHVLPVGDRHRRIGDEPGDGARRRLGDRLLQCDHAEVGQARAEPARRGDAEVLVPIDEHVDPLTELGPQRTEDLEVRGRIERRPDLHARHAPVERRPEQLDVVGRGTVEELG